jgi:hypothetical protein
VLPAIRLRAFLTILVTMKVRLALFCLLAAFTIAPHHALAAPLTLQDAIARVQRDTHGKVLSAETKHTSKQTIYRIKVLTRDGQVKIVEVLADE